jgi:hypothetical protein
MEVLFWKVIFILKYLRQSLFAQNVIDLAKVIQLLIQKENLFVPNAVQWSKKEDKTIKVLSPASAS